MKNTSRTMRLIVLKRITKVLEEHDIMTLFSCSMSGELFSHNKPTRLLHLSKRYESINKSSIISKLEANINRLCNVDEIERDYPDERDDVAIKLTKTGLFPPLIPSYMIIDLTISIDNSCTSNIYVFIHPN